MTGVDIVVPVFNSLHVVRPCLDSVLRNSSAPFRILLVDDASDTYTAAALDDYAASNDVVKLLRNERNLGFVHTANRGLSASTSDLVVLLNSDTIVPSGWVDRIRACFASDPTIGVASPVSNFAPHNRIPMLPGADHVAMDGLVEALSERFYPDVTTPEGFCYVLRSETLADCGPLDIVYDRGYGEESDLAMRANYRGWRTVCIDDLYVYHRGRASFGDDLRDRLYEANKGIFHSRWGQRYRDDFAAFKRRAPLDALRGRLAAIVPDGVESAFRDR
jgi:GT2 family glycosyltransferase